MWHIRGAGKLDCRQETKKLLAPAFKYSFLKGNKHGTDQVLAGGRPLGQGPQELYPAELLAFARKATRAM